MKSKMNNGELAIILGGLTLILIASEPYILDLIEPAKSIGQVIGENTKDFINSLKGEGEVNQSSKRDIWGNILSILSFISFTAAINFSIKAIQKGEQKWSGIIGGLLAMIGLGIYLFYMAIGLIMAIVLSVVVTVIGVVVIGLEIDI